MEVWAGWALGRDSPEVLAREPGTLGMAASLAQVIFGSTVRTSHSVAKPQSLPAMMFSLPTTLA